VERTAYLDLLRRWRWTLVLAAWVAGLVSFVAISQVPPTYEARARLLVGPVAADRDTVVASGGLAITYAELATAAPRLQAVIDDLGLEMTVEQLRNDVNVTATEVTRIVSIRASDDTAQDAAAIANALAEQVEALGAGGIARPEGRAEVFDPAIAPLDPVAPNVSLVVLLASIAGVLGAGLIALAFEYFSHTVKGLGEFVEVTSTPALGEININHGFQPTPAQPLVVEARPESDTAFGYQLIARRLPLGDHDDGRIRSFLVVGSQVGELAGEFAANLAAAIARTGRTVTVIDADDVESLVTTMFVPSWRSGMRELLGMAPEAAAASDVLESVTVKRMPNVDLIPIGMNASPMVREDSAAAILRATSEERDVVIVSGAALHQSATSLMWARLTDATILVARADVTRVENLENAIDSLVSVEAGVIGGVLLVRHGSRSRRRHPVPQTPIAPLRQASRPSDRSASAAPTVAPARDRRSGGPADRRAIGDKGAG
jgi:capsular polysaccharide biosynthesis protein